jgi:hypothetical protein
VDSRTNQMPHLDQSLQSPLKTRQRPKQHHTMTHSISPRQLSSSSEGPAYFRSFLRSLSTRSMARTKATRSQELFRSYRLHGSQSRFVARTARRLAVSQLVIAVLAFSACAIIIYALNWKKPKGISVPYTLLSFPDDIPSKVVRGIKPKVFDGYLLSLFDYEGPPETPSAEFQVIPVQSKRTSTTNTTTSSVYLSKPRSLEAFMLQRGISASQRESSKFFGVFQV